MSGLPANFPCPWCGMSYPAKPVLIGKTVRCKGCRNAFILQEDGVARKHVDPGQPAPAAPAQPPASAAVPAPVRPAPPASAPAPAAIAPRPPTQPAVVPPRPAPAKPAPPVAEDEVIEFGDPPKPASSPTPPPAPAADAVETRMPPPDRGSAPKSERLAKARKGKTEQMEAARAKIAADLAAVAAKAANSETAKREERKSERIPKVGSGAAAKPGSDGKQRTRKIVLTDEGMRLHRERLMWVVGSVVAVGVIVLLMMVFSFRSGIRAELDAYTAPVADTRFMAYGSAVRARAWLAATPSQPGGTAIALDLSDAEFTAQRTIDMAPLKDALAQLKGLRPLPGTGMWVAPADATKAATAIAAAPGESPVKALARTRIRAVELSAWAAKLGLDDEDRAVVLDLVAGTPSKDGIDIPRRILDDGEVPEKLLVRAFSGRKGDLRLDLGPPPYKAFSGPYRGLMLRIEGVGWPASWKVLELAALVGDKKRD